MGKDLPYFKFYVSEWNSGSITLEYLHVQGVFINLCSHYWARNGNVTLTEIKRRLSNAKPTAFDSLINNGIIKVENDVLTIDFLDEQLGERKKLSEVNAINGSLGGRPKAPIKPIAFEEETNIEERRGEEKRKEEKKGEENELPLSVFESYFDEQWYETMEMIHKGKDVRQAIREAYAFLQIKKRFRGEISEYKSCVQSFLSNKKPEINGKPGRNKQEETINKIRNA